MARPSFGTDLREQKRRRALDREQTDHFLSLPPEMQAELRESWAAELGRFDERFGERKRYLARSALEGAAVLSIAKLLFGWSVVATLVALPVGALTGVVWYLTRAKRFMCVVQVIPGFLLLALVGRPSIMLLFEAVFVVAVTTGVGTTREFRLGDDSVM